MPKRSRSNKPALPEIDMDFRPASYWADQDPIEAVVQNIKGQNRREMACDFLAGDMPKSFGGIDESLIADTLSSDARASLGAVHPRFMGGEYLPDYSSSEVEIARLVLQSSTQDVYSFRARRARPGARTYYRLVDEYDTKFTLRPASSTRPLALRGLVRLIDSTASDELDTMGWPLVEGFAAWQLENSESAREAADFVSVESAVYLELHEYFARRMSRWAESVEKERAADEADDEETDSADEGL